jgi:ABC-type polysaccharide/polyol phosphate transport system ATPase subunit
MVRGRFAPLLALGAGFNNELTGRQNVYLSAAIHGFMPKQVDAVMDDILAFADIGPFIDEPVKRYSSGMAARLGFSVAAFTLPDIIFLDEILAVGDVAFRQKCMERIRLFKQQRRTLLLVSHIPGQVLEICERALWIDHGQLMMDGQSRDVVNAYEQRMTERPDAPTASGADEQIDG